MSGKGGTNTGKNNNVPPSLRGETNTQKKIRIDNATNKAALGADAYARNELGITGPNVMNTPAGQVVTKGFTSSTSSNQMYGADYNQKRGEYLSQLGLAVGREATDAMGNKRTVYDPKNSDGVYTNISRNAMSQARDMGTPLSKEMYAGQQKMKLAFGALASGISGMPMFFSLAYMSSRKPYAEAVSDFYTKGQTKTTSTQTNNRNDSVNIASSEGQQSSYSQTTAKTKAKNLKARTTASVNALNKRSLLASNSSLIKGDM